MTQSSRSIRRYFPPLLFDAPDFRQLWLGQTISVFGDQITQLGLPLVAVLTLGADATQMGTLTAVGLLPHLLFSLVAGVWLDRVRARRRLMIAADLGRATLIGETTRGGAHPVDRIQVHPHLRITIPNARSISPRTGGNWEGVGVRPDIAVPAAEALDRAREHLRVPVA